MTKPCSIQVALFVLVCATQLSGCNCLPWSKERLANTPRVAERCTSISNVIGKNYEIGGKLNILGNGGGVGWSQTGVQLTAEAAERQIQMDRLCRAWAVGAITDEKWSDTYTQLVLASIAPLARSDAPEAQAQLKEATDALASATAELAKVRNSSTYEPKNDAKELAARIDQIAKSVEPLATLLEALHKRADAAFASTGLPSGKDPVAVGNPDLIAQFDSLRSDLVTQQRGVLTAIAAVNQRLELAERNLSGGTRGTPADSRIWKERRSLRVHFDIGKFDLTPEAKSLLDETFSADSTQEMRIELVGHTDISGDTQRNALLSVARAQEVRDYLVAERHVPARSVVAVGLQNSTRSFGPPAENRVVVVRVFENIPVPPRTSERLSNSSASNPAQSAVVQ